MSVKRVDAKACRGRLFYRLRARFEQYGPDGVHPKRLSSANIPSDLKFASIFAIEEPVQMPVPKEPAHRVVARFRMRKHVFRSSLWRTAVRVTMILNWKGKP
jgi:hypothetical protein